MTTELIRTEKGYVLWAGKTIKEQKEQIAALVDALEAVEWHPHTLYCPWCGMGKEDDHAADCQRQQALALAEGKE